MVITGKYDDGASQDGIALAWEMTGDPQAVGGDAAAARQTGPAK